ncbi:MAG TPA: MFS transporter [Phnomibacter sp.]|nr:MFS transporter [Phnomibacter sp.]
MLRSIAENYRRSFTGLAKESWLLSFVMLINRAGTMAVPFMSMYVTQAMHRSLSDAGLIITLFGIGSIMGAAAGGTLADKIGFRLVQICASILSGVLFIAFSFVHNFSHLCLLTVVLSFVAEAFRPANFTAIAAYSSPENITRSYSLNRLAINLGWAIGAALGGLLAAYNYSLLFYVEGGTNILAGLLILLLLPSAKKRESTHPKEAPPDRIVKPWQDAFFVRFILLTAIFNTCFFLVFRLVPVFWKEQWLLNESLIGMVLGMNGVIIALFEMVLVNKWEGKRPPMQFIIAGCFANSMGYVFLLLGGFSPLVLAGASMLMMTMGEMLAMPFMNTLIMRRSNAWNRGQYAAGYTLSWSVAQVIGPGGGAWIAQHAGYNVLWFVMIALCIGCALGFRWLSIHQKRFESYVSITG